MEQALDSIRDYLRMDGGDVRIHNITKDLVVELELLGACSNCSMSEMTMKAGVEEVIRKAVPEIKQVITIESQQVIH